MIGLLYLIVGVGFVGSLMVQGWLKTTYARWSQVRNSRNVTGGRVARHMLDQNGLLQVGVVMSQGALSDHYDPRRKIVALSGRIFMEPSVASAAIAAHECGHAIQDAEGYRPMRLRESMLPIAHLGAQYGPWAVIGGWMLSSPGFVQLGFGLYAASLAFQLFSLPIEFDASRRATKQLEEFGFDTQEDKRGTRKVLRAAALTYVAGSATAMGHLLVMIVMFGRSLFRKLIPLSTKP